MAQLGERCAECRGRCLHRPAAYGNVPGRDKAAKAPPVIAALDHLPCKGRLFARAEPARKPPHEVGRWPSGTRPEGLCPLIPT